MADSLYTENEILIHAPVSEVWDTLMNPEKTKQYMYGCEVVSNWEIGSPVVWKGAADGVVYVKGTLVALEKERIFAFTTFDPNDSYQDIPENHLTATYTLQPQGDATLLVVTQGDYAAVADGNKRYEDTMAQGGWGSVLEAIKQVVD